MRQEKGNFKGRVFGGFNRHDVIDYIEALAAERNSLKRENEELRERLGELEYGQPREPEEDRGQEIRLALAQARGVLDGIRADYDALRSDIRINATQAGSELGQITAKLTGLLDSLDQAGERLNALSQRLEPESEEGEDREQEQ